jgi:hypothetical protein
MGDVFRGITPISKLPSDTTPRNCDVSLPARVSPSSSESYASSSSHDDYSVDDQVKKIVKTEHKIKELEGLHVPEPLLSDNPGRFVLFPIQDNDVSTFIPMSFISN